MPEACPKPDGSRLDETKRAVLWRLVALFEEQKYARGPIVTRSDELVGLIDRTCESDKDIVAWLSEIHLWVRWFRRPGYLLAYLLQRLTLSRQSALHVMSCDLYADAQCAFAEDLAVQSLENAYCVLVRNTAAFGSSFAGLEERLRRKLKAFHSYYYRLARPFDFKEADPTSDNLYVSVTAIYFGSQFPEVWESINLVKRDGLDAVIEQCSTPDLAYYRVVARRHLGFAYSKLSDWKNGAEQYGVALEEAQSLKLISEIGHLRRLYACNLRWLGSFDQAAEQFRLACGFDIGPNESYWGALSFREYAHTLAQMPGTYKNPAAYELLLDTLFNARGAFDTHLGHCPIPIARDAKCQLFRSFSETAIHVLHDANRPPELLGEIEAAGPREATDVAAEISAARRLDPETLADYRRNRAIFHQSLSTTSPDFETYLKDVVERHEVRGNYLRARNRLSADFAKSTLTTNIVKGALDLKAKDVLLLLFQPGQNESIASLVDFSASQVSLFPMPFTRSTLLKIQSEYVASVGAAGTNPDAVATLVSRYEQLLTPLFRTLRPMVKGKHLKVFPRLQMNALPFQALRIDGEYLVETCDISYGQTLGLLLETDAAAESSSGIELTIVRGDGLPCYSGAIAHISSLYGDGAAVLQSPAWVALLAKLQADRPRDVVFACHGNFDRNAADRSHLFFDDSHSVSFQELFADLDLRGCRSILMGACESGISRAEIGAEYIGLPSAMLGSGVKYVVGALWQVNELATAILVERYSELLRDQARGVPSALCQAQRELLAMTRENVATWVADRLRPAIPEIEPFLQKQIAAMSDRPFAHPVFWAGMQVTGAT